MLPNPNDDLLVPARRRFLQHSAAVVAGLTLPIPGWGGDFWSQPRVLWLLRGRESAKAVYWADGKLIPEGYVALCRVLCDVQLNFAVQIDPVTLDILRGVYGWLRYFGIDQPITVLSGYRHPYPQLLAAALRLIEAASWRTAWIRMPSELLSHFAHFYWEGDETESDADSLEWLKERFDEDQETMQRYLPSVVRAELVPAALRLTPTGRRRRRDRRDFGLDVATLESLTSRRGMARLCRELILLRNLISRARGRDLLSYGYDVRPVYSAAVLVWENVERVLQLFDDIYQYEWDGGEATMHLGFIPIAQEPSAIRRQYAAFTRRAAGC